MKLKKIVQSALAVTLGSVASLNAQDVKPAAPAPAPAAQPAAPQYTESQILETLGWFIAKQQGFAELGFSKEQMDSLVKGMQGAAAGKEAPQDLEKIGPMIGNFMQAKQEAYFAKLKAEGKVEADKFFAGLKTNKAVTILPSGVGYEVQKAGAGDFPKLTDNVSIIYTGTLINGTKFDSNAGGETLTMPLKNFVPGFTEGMQKINKGGKIKLYIPPQLGYGEQVSPQIPPNSALIFEVELVDIKPADLPPPPPAPAAPAAPAATPAPKK